MITSSAPLVSLVTPSYNQAHYLEETMRSVLDQDYGNIEYIVIDGSSSDGSVELIRKYEDRLAYWVSEPDRGQADAINKGWSRCTGEIVAFLNSDDTYLPGALSHVVEAFRANPTAGVVYGQARWVTAEGVPVQSTRTFVTAQQMLDRFLSLPQPATFVRRQVLDRLGLLDASFHFALEGEFFIRALGSFDSVALPETLATMRLHARAKSVSAGSGFAPEILRIAQRVVDRPDAYPRYTVDRGRVLAGAHVGAARYLYMTGHYADAISHWRRALRLSPAHTAEVFLSEVPALVARLALGRQRYADASAAVARTMDVIHRNVGRHGP